VQLDRALHVLPEGDGRVLERTFPLQQRGDDPGVRQVHERPRTRGGRGRRGRRGDRGQRGGGRRGGPRGLLVGLLLLLRQARLLRRLLRFQPLLLLLRAPLLIGLGLLPRLFLGPRQRCGIDALPLGRGLGLDLLLGVFRGLGLGRGPFRLQRRELLLQLLHLRL